MAHPVPPATSTRKSVTGFVTKLVGDGATYGFINDEIFFQQTNVTDGPASCGDRVFAECEYSELLPIKWNATSIKIIGRASTGPANNILDSDPRRQSRHQGPLLPANTYQQHRQQRQQPNDTNQSPVSTSMQQPQQQQQPPQPLQQQPPVSAAPPMGMMEQQPEFFSPFAQPPPLQDLQPFQHDIPMGPPKLEYTSQLGAAFVQSQFMPGPLLPQQPPQQPMLPQHQPQNQQHPTQQHQRQQQNHRDQKGVRDANPKGRFNDKNDRNQSNRGRNRTDKKYEQPRSSERENSANVRSSRSGDSRDRPSGHGDSKANKRDDSSATRQSPVSHTARSANSSSSDKGHNAKYTPRRYYEAQNIPKTSILTNLNGWNMRTRCSSSIHVPSDLKNVIVNAHLRLDIKNTPKPILFKIDQQDSDESKVAETETSTSDTSPVVADSATNEDATSQSSIDNKSGEQITPPSSRSDYKLNHKYGVKVILISLPELESIYKKVFGPDLDSYSNESRTNLKLDEAIALLCNKGPNGGHSLIGGKFDPILDGFVEGETNEFERYGKQPDLIATCRRVVQEQTGLDLGPCQGWTLISTFLYNNKSDYFSPKSSVEYSFIYLPHIWSMTIDDLRGKNGNDSIKIEAQPTSQDVGADELSKDGSKPEIETQDLTPKPELNETAMSEDDTKTAPSSELDNVAVSSTEDNDVTAPESETTDDRSPEDSGATVGQVQGADESAAPGNSHQSSVTLESISDLKVVDLKLELEKRDIKYKPNAKKAELVHALLMSLTQSGTSEPSEQTQATEQAQNEIPNDVDNGDKQLEEGEVATDDDNTNDARTSDPVETEQESSDEIKDTNKRKSADVDDKKEQPDTKKICKDERKNAEKFDLITKPFVVRARQGQLQLTTLSLSEAVQASRYDQFELSVASTIMKESLTQHLSEYILTTLVEDSRQRSKETGDSSSTSSSISNSQDTANSDTNNNSTTKPASTATAAAATNQASSTDKVVKEYPVARYINLAFAYFDSAHMGYLQADDLFRLFINTGQTISKRALWLLIGEGDKFNYRTLPDLSTKFPPNHVYRFPDQFNRLPGSPEGQSTSGSANKMIEYQGVKYGVEKLIQQVRDAEINRVNMAQRFNDAISKHDQQEAEIHVLEVSQMSLSKSIKALNAEISELKREKSVADKRVESLKKQIKEAIKTLSES